MCTHKETSSWRRDKIEGGISEVVRYEGGISGDLNQTTKVDVVLLRLWCLRRAFCACMKRRGDGSVSSDEAHRGKRPSLTSERDRGAMGCCKIAR
ncbi:hypothetical protein Pyn_21517 [Prunus yedoensis var. nudiflora]|uniref:Uncharacterized protein n=1 Tax=Prunus yedoensis var. nudiflora TaxID=2094558 RepID=A0A314XQ97_PRUYE|nr:hypothetical protein Pyn_21517 [Prunus yedoensis var. nudiflora]